MYFNQQAKIAQIAKHIGGAFKFPIDVEGLCKSIGIELKYTNLDSAEAFLLHKNGKIKILVKKSSSVKRIRFSIAHELGHLLIPWHKQNIYLCNEKDIFRNGTIKEEIEANQFAADLLMPVEELRKQGWQNCDFEIILRAATYFNVSITAATIQINKCLDEEAAIVYCCDNKVIWSNKGKYFRGNIRNTRPFEENYDDLCTEKTLKGYFIKRELESSLWLNNREDDSLHEQIMLIPSNKGSLSILKFSGDTNIGFMDYIDPKDFI